MPAHQTDFTALWNFKRCAEEAPDGCYEEAKKLNTLLQKTCDTFMQQLRALGLKASPNDPAFDLEVALYRYANVSNPDATVFPTAEGFGASMGRPERERVLAQAASNRDALQNALQAAAVEDSAKASAASTPTT